MTNINLNNDELDYIEKMADYETSLLFINFTELLKLMKDNKGKREKELTQKIVDELIDTYTLLKGLRIKLENLRKNEKK